mgnify:CR=1 FL=1
MSDDFDGFPLLEEDDFFGDDFDPDQANDMVDAEGEMIPINFDDE